MATWRGAGATARRRRPQADRLPAGQVRLRGAFPPTVVWRRFPLRAVGNGDRQLGPLDVESHAQQLDRARRIDLGGERDDRRNRHLTQRHHPDHVRADVGDGEIGHGPEVDPELAVNRRRRGGRIGRRDVETSEPDR